MHVGAGVLRFTTADQSFLSRKKKRFTETMAGLVSGRRWVERAINGTNAKGEAARQEDLSYANNEWC